VTGPATGPQPELPFADGGSPRARLASRWLELTREVLPGMAADCGWPIHRDHCFMRVCLDAALGAPWHRLVGRPAVRHLTNAQLLAAVAVAERLLREPESLAALNDQSIRWRRGPADRA
jgi:hypothetical protein